MAWIDKTTEAIKVSHSETTDFIYQHPSAPLKTTVTTDVTIYRGLTQDAAAALAKSLVSSASLKTVFYYGGSAVSGEVVVALSGSKTDVQAERVDETCQWQVTATETTYKPDGGDAWSTSNTNDIVTSTTKSASLTFCGVAYTPTYYTDFYGHKTVTGTTAIPVWQGEETTSVTKRVAKEPSIAFKTTANPSGQVTSEGQVTYGDKDYGQVTAKAGTRVTVSATMLPQNKGWSVTTTTTIFTA